MTEFTVKVAMPHAAPCFRRFYKPLLGERQQSARIPRMDCDRELARGWAALVRAKAAVPHGLRWWAADGQFTRNARERRARREARRVLHGWSASARAAWRDWLRFRRAERVPLARAFASLRARSATRRTAHLLAWRCAVSRSFGRVRAWAAAHRAQLWVQARRHARAQQNALHRWAIATLQAPPLGLSAQMQAACVAAADMRAKTASTAAHAARRLLGRAAALRHWRAAVAALPKRATLRRPAANAFARWRSVHAAAVRAAELVAVRVAYGRWRQRASKQAAVYRISEGQLRTLAERTVEARLRGSRRAMPPLGAFRGLVLSVLPASSARPVAPPSAPDRAPNDLERHGGGRGRGGGQRGSTDLERREHARCASALRAWRARFRRCARVAALRARARTRLCAFGFWRLRSWVLGACARRAAVHAAARCFAAFCFARLSRRTAARKRAGGSAADRTPEGPDGGRMQAGRATAGAEGWHAHRGRQGSHRHRGAVPQCYDAHRVDSIVERACHLLPQRVGFEQHQDAGLTTPRAKLAEGGAAVRRRLLTIPSDKFY